MSSYARDIEPLSKQLTIVIGLTVVGFMAFGLALSFYRNILFEQTLREMEVRNREIAKEIDQNYRDLDYFRSVQFKDKYAKENLNKLNPGEKVMIITRAPPSDVLPTASGSALRLQQEAKFMEFIQQMPVSEQWWLYFFRRQDLERMREAL